MGRPPLAIGTHGSITAKQITTDPEQWRARTRYRDPDGNTRPVERYGPTADKAKRALRAALRARKGNKPSLTGRTSFGECADIWLDSVQRRRRGSSYDTYASYLKNHVRPGVGKLRIDECTVGRLQDYMDELEDKGMSAEARRSVRTILAGAMAVAVRNDLVATNPVGELADIESNGPRRKARSLTTDELADFLARLDADKAAQRYDLCDLIRFMLGTGVRIGEAVGIRWCDLNLGDEPVMIDGETVPPRTLVVTGNIVWVKGKGLLRHGGKTFKARRAIALPDYLHALLTVRRPASALDDEPVFPAGALTPEGKLAWKYPGNTGKSIRKLRQRMGAYDWVTSHTFRKTVATVLDGSGQTPREVADLLGHAQVSTTQNTYFGRGHVNPAAAAALDAAYRT